jgi:hypothetical protein
MAHNRSTRPFYREPHPHAGAIRGLRDPEPAAPRQGQVRRADDPAALREVPRQRHVLVPTFVQGLVWQYLADRTVPYPGWLRYSDGPGSLKPMPDRSYEQRRVNRATSGWTKPQPALEPPRPVSRTPVARRSRCTRDAICTLRRRRDVLEAESPPRPFESLAIDTLRRRVRQQQ